MSTTYPLREKLVTIARLDRNRVEVKMNDAPWIRKLWDSTTTPNAWKSAAPYCAAGMAYCLDTWLDYSDVRAALGFKTPAEADAWRCKSASCFRNEDDNWLDWAKSKGLQILPKNCILHLGDLVIYDYSHIEMVTDDDNTTTGPFTAIGYNTNACASRDGEGCYEKPRSRAQVKCFIRILP